MKSSNAVACKPVVATLSNRGRYTVFKVGDTRIMVIGPSTLEKYVRVAKWDRGYIVVQAKYSGHEEPIEEYVDLVPTLRNLGLDPDKFCSQISKVVVEND